MQDITTPKIKTTMYKICCRDPAITDVYVGQTKDLTTRRYYHKAACNNEQRKGHNCYVYQFIRANGGWDAWNVVPIEMYECFNRVEILARERYWVEILGATLNKQVPGRGKAGYYIDNKEEIKQRTAEYYTANKPAVQQQKAEYQAANKDAIKQYKAEYHTANKAVINQRRREGRDDARREYDTEYYAENKDAINKRRRERRAA